MNPNVPPEGVTEEMILAAQNYDLAHRGESIAALWRAVPDRQVARLIAGAAPLIRADGEMHELVFTDREARPAKWETRCGRADVPLERAGSAQPGMHYPVTCKACLRIAGLEAALKRFEHLEEAAIAAAVRRGIAGRVIPLLQAADSHITDLQNALWNHASVELDDGPDLHAAIEELSGAGS